MLLNSGPAAHCLQANTWEISVGWKGKFALFRKLATWGKADTCSFSYTYYQWPVNRNKTDSIVITNGNGLGEMKMNWPNGRKIVSTKNYSHNLKVEDYFIWWKCLALWAPRRHLSSAEKTAPRKWDGQPGYIQVCNKGSRKSEHQRLDIKLKNLAFYLWENATLWAYWIHCFHMYLSLLLSMWGCRIVWCTLTSWYLVSLLPVSIIHVSVIFLVGFWSWEISFILWGCRGWGWQAAGTWVSVSHEMVGFPTPIGWPGACQSMCTQ